MNIVDVVIVILLLLGLRMGYRRGFILQTAHLIGFILAFLIAYRFSGDVAVWLAQWVPYPWEADEAGTSIWGSLFDAEAMYYTAIAFVILFFGTKFGLQLLARWLNMITVIPGIGTINRWLGAALGFGQVFIILFVIVHAFLFLPWETMQELLYDSRIARWMSHYTPLLSEWIETIWTSTVSLLGIGMFWRYNNRVRI